MAGTVHAGCLLLVSVNIPWSQAAAPPLSGPAREGRSDENITVMQSACQWLRVI